MAVKAGAHGAHSRQSGVPLGGGLELLVLYFGRLLVDHGLDEGVRRGGGRPHALVAAGLERHVLCDAVRGNQVVGGGTVPLHVGELEDLLHGGVRRKFVLLEEGGAKVVVGEDRPPGGLREELSAGPRLGDLVLKCFVEPEGDGGCHVRVVGGRRRSVGGLRNLLDDLLAPPHHRDSVSPGVLAIRAQPAVGRDDESARLVEPAVARIAVHCGLHGILKSGGGVRVKTEHEEGCVDCF
mmetsp:Transcript_14472/g.26749  ORF Transcript_14472/g.26749 Transcript_14472/m.26749 type:complete len:238 (-) Transcript_14472:1138-1851(-)